MPVVFVPTMGALHAGHTSLLDMARQHADADAGSERGTVVASIFVNPLQFGPNEDLEKYPRTEEADLQLCREHGVDQVFLPRIEDMYPPDRSVAVQETDLSQLWEGRTRPGHFDGVCTVVLKLFHIVQPDIAIFGQKDYQQLAIIRRMVRDLDIPITILSGATIREDDGLALSSRNRYLSAEERPQAIALRRALLRGQEIVQEHPGIAGGEVREAMEKVLGDYPLVRKDYLTVANAETLQEPAQARPGDVLLGAIFLGTTRLIDNLIIQPSTNA